MPVVNPDSGRSSRAFTYRGKVDLVEGGRIVDWKSVADPDSFILKQTIGYQAELYALALQHSGTPITSIEYRLIRRPTIRLCGKDASPEAYEERCVAWLRETGDALRPHEVLVNPARLEQARRWLWGCVQRVLVNRRTSLWLTSEEACNAYGRLCEYAPLCLAEALGADVEDVIAQRYEVAQAHEELEDDSRDVMTYSSARLLTLCERRYLWRYVRCLRPRNDSAGEAQWNGSATHVGFEALATEGLDAALTAIDAWAGAHPILGEDAARQQDQQVARARAMVRAAAERWVV